MDEIIIDKADKTDAAEILELQQLAYQSEAEIYQDWTIPPLMQTLEDILAEFTTYTFLRARLHGRIIGSVRAYVNEAVCTVEKLIVHPQMQRRGANASATATS